MKCSSVTTSGTHSKGPRPPLHPPATYLHLSLYIILAAVWLPALVESQNNPFGFSGTHTTRSVDTPQELADAWADATVDTALVQGELLIDGASWRQKFSAAGGVAALAQSADDTRTNFTIAGGLPCANGDHCGSASSRAAINFQRLPYTFMVGSRGVLQIQNMVLYDIALAADYKYSPEQPYRAVIVGSDLWPIVGLAPGAIVRLVNVSVAYRNTDPELTCEQRVSLGVYSLQQLRGKDIITFRNSTAGWVPGNLTSVLKIVNGSDNSSLGEATIYIQNLTSSCLPSITKQRLFGKLTASQLALAVSVPVGASAALIAFALCLRHHRRKGIADDSSGLPVKDVESGLSQPFVSCLGLSDSMCKRKHTSGSSAAGSSFIEVHLRATTDKDHSSEGHWKAGDVAQLQVREVSAEALPADGQLQVPIADPYGTSLEALSTATPFAAIGHAVASRVSATVSSDGMVGLSSDQQFGHVLSGDSRMPSTILTASSASTSSQPVPRCSADADAYASRLCSVALTVSSSNSSQRQQQQSGSIASPTSRQVQSTYSSMRSRRLSFEDYQCDPSGCRRKAPSGVPALLKARSDIAVLRDLKIGQLLGTGSYGRVYKGRWKSVVVAVKVMEHHSTACSITSSNTGKLVMAGRETALASSMAHPNVVQTYHISTMTASQRRTLASTWTVSNSFKKHHNRHHGDLQPGLGTLAPAGDDDHAAVDAEYDNEDEDDVELAVVEPKDPLETWLIMEFCEKGSLEKAVKSGALLSEGGKSDMIGIYKVLLDIASGLDYLHSMGVVHGDLKTANVLLKGSTRDACGFACKITDFGLSRVLDHDATHVSTRTYGTITYMPKEVLLTGHVSQTTDIYSFGLMMWELYAGCSVYEDGMSIGQLFYMIAYSDWRPEIPSDCPPGYSDLMRSCWHQDPEQRPTAQQLLRTVQKLYTEAKQAARAAARHSTSQSTSLASVVNRSQQQRQRQTYAVTGNSSEALAEVHPTSGEINSHRENPRNSRTCLLGSSRCSPMGSSARASEDEPHGSKTDDICFSGSKTEYLPQMRTCINSSSTTPPTTASAGVATLNFEDGCAGRVPYQTLIPMVKHVEGVVPQTSHQQQRQQEQQLRRSTEVVNSSRPASRRTSFDSGNNSGLQHSRTGVACAGSAAPVAAVPQGREKIESAEVLSGSSTPSARTGILYHPQQQPEQPRQQRRQVSFQEQHIQDSTGATDDGVDVKQSSFVLNATGTYSMINTSGSSLHLGYEGEQQQWQLPDGPKVTQQDTTAAAANAHSAATIPTAAQCADGSQHEQSPSEQQQQCHQQLCSFYQLRSSNEQQPTLDSEPMPSESLFAAADLPTTSTWQDYSSGGDTSQGLLLQDSAHFAAQIQPQYLQGLQAPSFPVPWQQQQQACYPAGSAMLLKPVGYSQAAALAAQNFLEALEMATRSEDGANQ